MLDPFRRVLDPFRCALDPFQRALELIPARWNASGVLELFPASEPQCVFVNVTPDLIEFMDFGFPRLFAYLLALDHLDFPDSSGFSRIPRISGIPSISLRYPCIKNLF